jgi:hypothetical protein
VISLNFFGQFRYKIGYNAYPAYFQ